jgi:NTP pyrophosphatase (non-canonical NTP hydrolase)
MHINKIVNGLNESAAEIHQANVEKGFWQGDRNVGELLMLVTSELGEAMEAHRKGLFCKVADFEEENVEHFAEFGKDTFEDEMADSLIRILDMCAGLGIDIEKHVNAKLAYNKTRPIRHGKKY